MSRFFKHIFLSFFFVIILFTPDVRFLPHYTWFLSFLGIITLADKEFCSLIKFKSGANKNFLYILLFTTIFNALFVPLLHFTFDFTYAPLNIGIVLTLFRNLLLVYLLHKLCKHRDIEELYYKYYFIACCIYVGFTLYFIIDPNFKSFWLESIITETKEQTFAAYQFRYSLDGFAAFSSATVFSFACLFCSFLIIKDDKLNMNYIICLILMVVGCFFYGRVSLAGIALGAMLILLNGATPFRTIKIIGIVVGFISVLLFVLNILSQENEALLVWQDWAFSFLKQLFIEKEITDYSVTHMYEDMYFMPEWTTLLFGDGLYTNKSGSYYMHTDVGFMRLICYGGLTSLMLTYSIVFKLVYSMKRINSQKTFNRFLELSILLMLILEMKGECYQRFIMQLYPLFLILNYKNSVLCYNLTKGSNE